MLRSKCALFLFWMLINRSHFATCFPTPCWRGFWERRQKFLTGGGAPIKNTAIFPMPKQIVRSFSGEGQILPYFFAHKLRIEAVYLNYYKTWWGAEFRQFFMHFRGNFAIFPTFFRFGGGVCDLHILEKKMLAKSRLHNHMPKAHAKILVFCIICLRNFRKTFAGAGVSIGARAAETW